MKKKKEELDVDFIGGQEKLTKEGRRAMRSADVTDTNGPRQATS